MHENQKDKEGFSLKQRFLLYFYRTQQLIRIKSAKLKQSILTTLDSTYFHVIIFIILLLVLNCFFKNFGLDLANDQLMSMGLAVAGVIGASIAIVFSFSTFILQSTADLFSTQYLNKFIQDKKEKYIFWLLVILTLAAIIIPLFPLSIVFESLLSILFVSFLLIYSLYKQLRQRINPETTLSKIKVDAFHNLKRVRNEFEKQANIQNKIYEYEKQEEKLTVVIQYKAYPQWKNVTLENIKYLYEIGLRLLSKNEINSFNQTLKYIHDIYIEHLRLRSGQILCVPAGLWGTYTFEDENFTSSVLEYFESISHRLIQEKRKENIYYLLSVYESLIDVSLKFKYAEQNTYGRSENPILNLILSYYIGFIDRLTESNQRDWIWESLKSLTRVSSSVFSNEYKHFNHNQINDVVDRIVLHCIKNEQSESLIKQAVLIYFTQIKIGWNKYSSHNIFWSDIFKRLKKSTLALAVSSEMGLASSELHIGFNTWLVTVCNGVVELEESEEKKKTFDNFVLVLKRWSEYLLDFARATGLENKQMGLSIIQAVDCNLRIIYHLNNNFEKDLSSIYQTQLNALSWYFQGVDSIDESYLFNLGNIQETLIWDIHNNLTEEKFDPDSAIKLYIQLVKNHFDKVSLGNGYNHPRVIEKLVYLGLILHKHKRDTSEIVSLIDSLNKRYLILNKDYLEMKAKTPNLMGPDVHQLCKELHELENDLFSYNSYINHGVKMILKQEITKEIWDEFIVNISHCKGIEYETRRSPF